MSRKITLLKLEPLPDNVLTILNINEGKNKKDNVPTVISPISPLPLMSPLPPISPMVPLPTPAVHDPIKISQYTQELQMTPLSPRSPRVKINNLPIVVTHNVEPIQTETCCICYDEEIPTHNLLTCKHPVCGECVKELNKPECPMCKQFLAGALVTDNVLADIMNRQEQARLNEITANYLAGVYLEENPEADPEEVYDRYRN